MTAVRAAATNSKEIIPVKTHSYRWLLPSACSLFIAVSGANAKDKKTKTPEPPKDEIQVVGHVDLTGGAVTSFQVTQHYSSSYLYAERGSGQPVMLLDVTKPDKPAVLGDMAYATNGAQGLMLVAGTAALSASTPAAAQPPAGLAQTIRIMDFSDPKNPKAVREFTGVTAIARDDKRGLVFLADGSGIWILRQRLAMDPEIEKAYENYVNYYR
jgi:hypothetical protein